MDDCLFPQPSQKNESGLMSADRVEVALSPEQIAGRLFNSQVSLSGNVTEPQVPDEQGRLRYPVSGEQFLDASIMHLSPPVPKLILDALLRVPRILNWLSLHAPEFNEIR